MFLVVGGTKFGYSNNGVDWTFSANGGTNNRCIARSDDGTLMVGQASGYVMKSTDAGATWSNTTSNTFVYSLLHSNIANLWLAGSSNGYVRTSIDGSSWDNTRPYTARSAYTLAESSSLIVAVLSTYGVLCTSPDAINWTATNLKFDSDIYFYHLLYANSRFVLTGNPAFNKTRTYYSDNGLDWYLSTGIPNTLPRSVCWDGSKYILVTDFGVLYTSANAETWVSAGNIGFSESMIRRIACLPGGPYVIVSEANCLYTSLDAVTWSKQTFASTPLRDVIAYGESNLSSLYDHTIKLMCNGGLDWDTDDLRAVLVTADYTFNAAHTARSSISSYEIADSEVTLSSTSVTDTALILPSVVFPGFYGTPSAFVIFKNAVVGGINQPLLFYSPLGSITNSGTQLTIIPMSSTFASLA